MSTPTVLFSDFAATFRSLLSSDSWERLFAGHGPRGGGNPKFSPWQWIMARIRLWTIFLDPADHPAMDLVELSAKRREEELNRKTPLGGNLTGRAFCQSFERWIE